MTKELKNDLCDRCDKPLPPIQGIFTEIDGEEVLICAACWNKFVARDRDSNFETIELKPITLKDCEGKPHEFRFMTHLLPPRLFIHAREVLAGEEIGYSFHVHGQLDCSQEDLILDLYAKMRRGLAIKSLKRGAGQMEIKDSRVVGRISSSGKYDGMTPTLVIDGEPVTWAELGKMLMTFEGWQFRLDILDRSEEA